MQNLTILLIDDEESQRTSLKSFLERRNYNVLTAENGKLGFEIVMENNVDIILTDYRMPEWTGLEVLENVKKLNPTIDIVIITAFGNVDEAVTIMKAGAYDYLTKPIDLDELENLLHRIIEKRHLVSENQILKTKLRERFKFDKIITQSSEMDEVLNTAARISDSKASVIIRGESGTGKELIANAVHYASPRAEKPFVTVNVASLSENLLESELFGHEKGAFTGAVNQRIGRFEEADTGTIFIDEVGDIPMNIQVKLLRTIQFGEVQRLGSNETKNVDVRILAATNRNLEEMISNGEFREDLFYRLNVVTICIPPLRNRKNDVPMLIDHFIKKYGIENNKNISGISKEALDQLVKYNYPGNIRELENIIQRAVVLARDEYLLLADLPIQTKLVREKQILNPHDLDDSYENKMHSFESELISTALDTSNGNKSAAARILGITERHLRSRLERLNKK
ncbi:MAG: sigma-54-dependent Fis family transcriptional regulator [Melioribacteraceae bacterium]|nr:sigma-54-dependent Fis family transcriptional regulator [Melioribacteraceae bacterium]